MFKFCFHKYKYVYEKEKKNFLDGVCKVLKKRFRICQKCGKAQKMEWCFICEPFMDWITLSECEREILLKNIKDCGDYYLLKKLKKRRNETMVKKYRKKPIIVEAVQWTGDNYEEIYEFTRGNCCLTVDDNELIIRTLEGDMQTKKGSYIIKGKAGEFYPCKKEIFEQTYEEEV